MNIYRDNSGSKSLRKKEGVDEESNKSDIERRACSQNSDVPHTNFSMYFFL